jgi:hypothetical protein
MKRLVDLSPALFTLDATNPQALVNLNLETDELAEAQGVQFTCPKCGEHRIVVMFESVPTNVWEMLGRWKVAGNSMHDITILPSIQVVNGCRWHGYVKHGEVHDYA